MHPYFGRRKRNRIIRPSGVLALLGAAIIIILCGCVLLLIILPRRRRTVIGNHQSASSSSLRPPFHFRNNNKSQSSYRIAILIPFVGESIEQIPTYLELFLTAAAGSASLVDFLILHNGILDHYHDSMESLPTNNVKFLSLGSTSAFVERLMKVVDHKQDDQLLAVGSKQRLHKILSTHIRYYPYVLVEFKPALAYIFEDYLRSYSHWGYSDLDVLFGDLPRHVTPEELLEFDIVTYSYGDQDRLYLRGQFTIHKNTQKVNNLWRKCRYLTDMDERFAAVLEGKKKLHVESAEGCYSQVILQHNELRVKYAAKAWTDVDKHDTAHTHGLYLGIGSHRDKSVLYKAGKHRERSLLQLSPTWFESRTNVYGSRERRPLQHEVGSRQVVERRRPPPQNNKDGAAGSSSNCMYWVQEQYQKSICITEKVESTDTMFWIDGVLYKQRHENLELPGNVVSAAFFHFQEWKRYYRAGQLASVHRRRRSTGDDDALGWVLAKEGAIPLLPAHHQHMHPWSSSSSVVSPLGIHLSKWKGQDTTTTTTASSSRSQLPSRRYCLVSGPRKVPPRPPAPQCEQSVSWQDEEAVEILSDAPVWTHVDVKHEVTLALTLQITPKQAANHEALDGVLEIAMANIRAWKGQPCVLVIHAAAGSEESLARLRGKLDTVDDVVETCLVALIATSDTDDENDEKGQVVSRKALINMAYDAAPTRWAVTGVEIERGMILSSEASMFAYRKSKVYTDTTGNVFIVPQFSIDHQQDITADISLKNLAAMKQKGEPRILQPDDFEKGGDCDDSEHGSNTIFLALHELWWKQTLAELNGRLDFTNEVTLRELTLACDEMQMSFERLLTSKKHFELFAMDVSPILMIDSVGPRRGMKTFELVREVEEFGGMQCYNAMRLAQLAALGYRINMLPGAFALSTTGSRRSAFGIVQEELLGASRCDGCFMFYDNHEDILEDIVNDERRRPAKAAALWNDMYQTL